MRVLGLLKVPSRGPCHLPLFSLPMPCLPLCNNMLEPTSVFNSMFIWTALGKWNLSLKAGVLKQQHDYKQLHRTNRGMKVYVCTWEILPYPSCSHFTEGLSTLVPGWGTIESWIWDSFIPGSNGHLLPHFPSEDVPECHNLNQHSGCSQAPLLAFLPKLIVFALKPNHMGDFAVIVHLPFCCQNTRWVM